MKITEEDVISKVRELAKEKPDFVYHSPDGDSCWYVMNGEGSCIVGQAMIGLGFDAGELESHELEAASNLLDGLNVEGLTPHGMAWINRVQERQDDGFSWQKAIEYANFMAENPDAKDWGSEERP